MIGWAKRRRGLRNDTEARRVTARLDYFGAERGECEPIRTAIRTGTHVDGPRPGAGNSWPRTTDRIGRS